MKEKECRILSGSMLKVIAMISMLVDHTALIIGKSYSDIFKPYFTIGSYHISDYFICRNIIGRIAFPIFAFLLVEGYVHTKDRKKYALNLLFFAFLSIIPWNLIHGSITYHNSINVMFTLFMGVMGMRLLDAISDDYKVSDRAPWVKIVILIIGILLLRFLRLDYGIVGVTYILILYLLRGNRLNQFIATIAAFSYNKYLQFNILAFIPISLYNGNRGFIKGKLGKYCMYAFYPLHLLILWFIFKR